MTPFFYLIDQLALGLYVLTGVVFLWHGRRMLSAAMEYRSTYFELERELARQQQAAAFTAMIITVQVALIILGVQQSVVPFLESEERWQEQVEQVQVAQADDGEFNTATPPPIAGGVNIEPVPPLGGDDGTILLLTPTLTPTPVGTIVPNAPATEGCTDPRAALQIPANGMRVFQPIAVVGTAYTDEFTTAKIEISGPSTNNTYSVIGESLQPVRDATALSQFSPSEYIPGVYKFRLMVFDISNMPVASCMVNIYISAPPVTPTPTPALGTTS